MSFTTPLPGVRLHPNGRSWQVRIHPYASVAGFPTVDDANEYAVELRRLKRQGILVAPPRNTVAVTTLATFAWEHLERLGTVGGRRKTPYSAESLHQARLEARPWTGEPVPPRFVKGGGTVQPPQAVDENGIPFSQTPLSALRVRPIETYLERRYVLTPRAAVGEHQSLQAILRLAARRGETFQQGLLMIEPLRRRTRKRTGLAPDHIDYLADTAPDHQQRLLRLAKTLGNRITELLLAEDAWLVDGAIVIPAWACKERREKTLHLLPEEQVIIREQRLVRSPGTVLGRAGTPLLFPRKHGTAWKLHAYWTKVVIPVRRKAAERWRAEHELPAGADTPFEWTVVDDHGRPIIEPDGSLRIGGFAPHDLRRSAADLLRRLGIEDRLIAARFGHADQGQLVAATYAADTRREELAAELQAIAAEGGTTARLERLAEARR